MKDLLLVTPPFTQLNTPYPATAYLKGFLNTKQISSFQLDLGMEVIWNLFTKDTLQQVFAIASNNIENQDANLQHIVALKEAYVQTVETVIQFLQSKEPSIARLLCSENFLPKASRFHVTEELDWAFGTMGFQDKAKHFATLYLEDLSDLIVASVDADFGFTRYAERLGRSAYQMTELEEKLLAPPTFIDKLGIGILKEIIRVHQPQLVCFSVPFPGNLYSAFRMAQWIKTNHPNTKTAMGGGFANTELRSLTEPKVFQYFDYITLDDGELPIELLWKNTLFPSQTMEWKRTYLLENNQVVYCNNASAQDYPFSKTGTPDYSDLKLNDYLSVIEVANPMHSLWSDGRWNKLTMAHGCYWGKCTFCDVSLDYIRLYEPITAKALVDKMEELIQQTGNNGFHFVDEAAPPALMKEVSLEIIQRGLVVSWWTNIRFEKSFTANLCRLLQASGCIAVSGGLEVASDRLLEVIQKGVTVEQVAQVTHHFTQAGIMVHAYLMYGYPTQTEQETIDSLEMVRQLFALGILQSGFWHQFALTAHSPIGLDPKSYGLTVANPMVSFALNDLEFTDKKGVNHEKFSFGLKKSLFNYMHGIGLEEPLSYWFDFKIPRTTIAKDYIAKCIQNKNSLQPPKPNQKLVWLATEIQLQTITKSKKGTTWELALLQFSNRIQRFSVEMEIEQAKWLQQQINHHLVSGKTILIKDFRNLYENQWDHFELFWFGKSMEKIKKAGLLVV
ncbi:MAG: B12-binding domain-containing radical SAM protein [Flavobacterium sp.]